MFHVQKADLDVCKLKELLRIILPPVIGLDAEDAQVPRCQAFEHRQHLLWDCDVCQVVVMILNLHKKSESSGQFLHLHNIWSSGEEMCKSQAAKPLSTDSICLSTMIFEWW